MKVTTRAARYALATAAIGGAAILIPAIALAAPARPAEPASATAPTSASTSAPKCSTGALTAWLGIPGNGYAGGVGYELELSNTSHRTCTLYGYPGVSAIGAASRQLGSAAARDHADPTRRVTLAPGATAHVQLLITDVGNFPASACHPANASELRIYPPNVYGSIEIPFSFRACGKRGPIFLTVTTAVRGAGIPGFSS